MADNTEPLAHDAPGCRGGWALLSLAYGLLKSPRRPSYRQGYPQSHLPSRDPQGSSDRRDGAGGGGRPGQASGQVGGRQDNGETTTVRGPHH